MKPRSPIVVMYHTIWPYAQPIPGGIRPLLASEFESQLDWLAERYHIVDANEFLARYPRGENVCLLTFDDGTKDHATVATPILARRKLSGVFFVCSAPPQKQFMPLTHAVHWLLGNDPQNIFAAFEKYAREHLGGVDALGSPQEAKRIYHYESPVRARIKYAVNMSLPAKHARAIIETFVAESGETFANLASQWFASAAQIMEMRNAGMTIGMHGATHQSLQSLGDKIADEINECGNYLTDLLSEKPAWWACPFGGSGASREAIDAMNASLQKWNIRGAVSTIAQMVSPDDSPLALPRIDAANLPPRKSDFT